MMEIKKAKNYKSSNGNAWYQWIREALEFCHKNNIKLIDWPSYSRDLNQIGIFEYSWKWYRGRNSTAMLRWKNELNNILEI